MKLLTKSLDYTKTIELAKQINGSYYKSVIFHCYWTGKLNEKHLISIKSCYYFNVLNKDHKIILWVENNTKNDIYTEISKYCEIKQFSFENEIKNTNFIETNFIDTNLYYKKSPPYYSDVVRCLLLYNYGGCWFDLDCFFLRSFDPIFKYFENQICVYQWENRRHPNNAIFISLKPKCIKMKKNMNFIIHRNKGWGFQEASLSFDLPLDMLVLPCSWFDPEWTCTPNSKKENFRYFFKKQDNLITIDNFHKNCFCYHWHNKWNDIIEEKSPMYYLYKDLESKLII